MDEGRSGKERDVNGTAGRRHFLMVDGKDGKYHTAAVNFMP